MCWNNGKMDYKISSSPSLGGVAPIYVDEPWLIDQSMLENYASEMAKTAAGEDNIRVYIPLDINRRAIRRRLNAVIIRYGEVSEKNECEFSTDVDMVLSQLEIYDRILCERGASKAGNHSAKVVDIVREAISVLEEVPDGCACQYPFETIAELKREYLQMTERESYADL